MDQSTPTYNDPQVALQAKNLTKAIFQTESGSDYNAKGKSGESGAGQWIPATWKTQAKDVLGDENAPMSPQNQSVVAQGTIRKLIGQGKNAAQIAAIWNSGSDENWENKVGKNSYGVTYNVPKYVKSVTDAYQTIKGGGQVGIDPSNPSSIGNTGGAFTPSPTQSSADQESQKDHGSIFGANTENGNALGEVAKTAANVPKSAFDFVIKNPINMLLHPIDTLTGIVQHPIDSLVPQAIRSGLSAASGAVKSVFSNTGEDAKAQADKLIAQANTTTDPTQKKALLAQAGALIKQGANEGTTHAADLTQTAKGLQTAQREITNDPIGQIAPAFIAAEGGAKLADNIASKSAMADYVNNIKENVDAGKPIPKPTTTYGDMVDTAIKKTASPITKAASTVFGKVGNFASDSLKYGISKATGLNAETIDSVTENPKSFSKENMAKFDRTALASDVQSSLDKRISDLQDTGKAYQPIRESTKPIKISSNFLDDTIKEVTGTDIKKGKIETSGAAKIRDLRDVRALQNLRDTWGPIFKKGEMTPNEFLNFRADLAKLSKFGRDVGKSTDLEASAQLMRGRLNTAYRPQLDGLQALDKEFSTQTADFKNLKQGLLSNRGNPLDGLENKIANATGKGKTQLLQRLEQVSPGITQKIKIVKAIEDIKNASGFKVGNYVKAGAEVGGVYGGLATGNIPLIAGSVAAAILTAPENAVKILQGYGYSKPLVNAVIEKLQVAGSKINSLPESKGATTASVFGRKSQ